MAYFMLWLLPTVLGACYTPHGLLRGNDTTGGEYLPCRSDGASMCCAFNRPGLYKNTCRDDGLCDVADSKEIYRESCTDPTWQDPRCIKLCVFADRDDTKVTDCGGGRYCCGHRNETCCNAGDGYYIRAGSAVPALIQQPSTLASTPTTTGENTVTSVSSTNLSSTPTSQSTAFRSSPPARVEESASETPSGHAKKDDGMQLGLGLGVALPATLAAIATLVLAYIRFKNGKKTQKRRQDYNRLQPRTRTV